MSDDIVEQLVASADCRRYAECAECGYPMHSLLSDSCNCPCHTDPSSDAAAEIVWLRAENRFLGESGAIDHARWKAVQTEIKRLRAERDDHKARLSVEAFTAPDADYDTMMDSLQARLSDLHTGRVDLCDEVERLRAAGDALAETLTLPFALSSTAARDAWAAWQEARRG